MLTLPSYFLHCHKGMYEEYSQVKHRIDAIRKAAPAKLLVDLFGNRIDVENDTRIPAAAELLGMSVAALTWRIADLMENNK